MKMPHTSKAVQMHENGVNHTHHTSKYITNILQFLSQQWIKFMSLFIFNFQCFRDFQKIRHLQKEESDFFSFISCLLVSVFPFYHPISSLFNFVGVPVCTVLLSVCGHFVLLGMGSVQTPLCFFIACGCVWMFMIC